MCLQNLQAPAIHFFGLTHRVLWCLLVFISEDAKCLPKHQNKHMFLHVDAKLLLKHEFWWHTGHPCVESFPKMQGVRPHSKTNATFNMPMQFCSWSMIFWIKIGHDFNPPLWILDFVFPRFCIGPFGLTFRSTFCFRARFLKSCGGNKQKQYPFRFLGFLCPCPFRCCQCFSFRVFQWHCNFRFHYCRCGAVASISNVVVHPWAHLHGMTRWSVQGFGGVGCASMEEL